MNYEERLDFISDLVNSVDLSTPIGEIIFPWDCTGIPWTVSGVRTSVSECVRPGRVVILPDSIANRTALWLQFRDNLKRYGAGLL